MRDRLTYSFDWDGTAVHGPPPLSGIRQWSPISKLPHLRSEYSEIQLGGQSQFIELGLVAYALGYLTRVALRPIKQDMLAAIPYILAMKSELGEKIRVIISSGREKEGHQFIQRQSRDPKLRTVFDTLFLDLKNQSVLWKGDVAEFFVNNGFNFIHVDNDWLPFWLMAQINRQFESNEMPCLGYLLMDTSNRFLNREIKDVFRRNNIHFIPNVLVATLDLQRRIKEGKFTDN